MKTTIRRKDIKKKATHSSSIREPGIDFRKLVDKLEQAEITMKLEETDSFNLKYVSNLQTSTSQIKNIQDSDIDFAKKKPNYLT